VLDQRKASILRAVVEEYIDSAQPVGSGHVAAAPGVEVSPATVRNEMALLEQEGYLVQPHTSAGRIPTDKGYRYFVDTLVGPTPLGQDAAHQVRAFFNKTHGEIEQMLSDTTRLLSDLTDSAAVVVGPHHEQALVRSVQLVGLGPRIVLLVAVLSNGSVEKRTIDLVEDADEATVTRAAAHVDSYLRGRHFTELSSIGTSGHDGADKVVDETKTALTDIGSAEDQVWVGGTARMAGAFQAVETIREVLGILEQQLVVVTLLRDVLDRGLSVAIGAETGMAPLAECSLVVAPYAVEGEQAGTIGVLGPTRMNYPQALAAVAVVSKRLGRRLSEG
jgi:heat-inducible transcriptional repressor